MNNFKKKILLLLVLCLVFIPINTKALSSSYKDNIHDITNTKVEKDKINIYLFHGYNCPHCKAEKEWLKTIKEDYKDYVNIYYFEVWKDSNNLKLMNKVKDRMNIKEEGVPLTIIGDKYFIGFSDITSPNMENAILKYANLKNNPNSINLPILGKTNLRNISVPIVAVILGLIDGFNPCAMWILLFLISMLFNLNDRKKSWILGLAFLLSSSLVYFLSMLGINIIINSITIKSLQLLIAIFILIFGFINLRKYFKTRKEENGCSVVDNKKRKKLFVKIKNIINNKSFILSLIGIIILAGSVNLIELACSLGFPLVYTEILSINNITGISRIIYILFYILFYMLDDIIVFTISMITLEATGITNKYNKLCTLISAIVMILMGLLLIFKPEWLMLNF